MQIQKIDNTHFQGYKFKNMYAKRVFDGKLRRQSKSMKNNIQDYIRKYTDERVLITINSTKIKNKNGESVLFATFSYNDNIVVEKSGLPKSKRLKDFITRCAKEAGYKRKNKKQMDDADKLLELASRTLEIFELKSIR